MVRHFSSRARLGVVFKMADDELAAIRAKRLAELQGQYGVSCTPFFARLTASPCGQVDKLQFDAIDGKRTRKSTLLLRPLHS